MNLYQTCQTSSGKPSLSNFFIVLREKNNLGEPRSDFFFFTFLVLKTRNTYSISDCLTFKHFQLLIPGHSLIHFLLVTDSV